MCLIAIDERLKPNKREVRAWGVFRRGYGSGAETFYTAVYQEFVPPNVWHKAHGFAGVTYLRLDAAPYTHYPFGFHKFATRHAAQRCMESYYELKDCCVRPVVLRDVRVVGKQKTDGRRYKCYVAKEMLVPEVKK